jgi:glucose dehydrogenase
MNARSAASAALFTVLCAPWIAAQNAQAPRTHSEARHSRRDWPTVDGDAGDMKFTALTQVTQQNVQRLTKAWIYDMGQFPAGARMEFTPVVVSNVLYFSPPNGKVVALKADTGAELWSFDLRSVTRLGLAGARGIAYWPGTAQARPRIVVATTDGLLVQLDARTGKLIPKVGKIDLGAGITEKFDERYSTNMPPGIYKDLAVIAARTGENGRWGIPGDPRAFGLLTGKEVWRFHVIPRPGETNFGTWGLEGWQDRRGNGVWVPLTIDTANGIVFVPTGNANDQDYGYNRPGSNLYAATLLALDANTGKLKWYFQIAHHDIYDQDVNSPPSLIEVVKDGQRIPAVAQLTKMGYLFILNRLTGKPIFGVEERPVPDTDAPGDHAWPTQPFPVKPQPLARDAMTRKEIAKLSPESEKFCQALYDKAVNMGPYTPYGMVPSLVFPSSEGGGGWGGVAFDPGRHLIFVNPRSVGLIAQLQPYKSNGVLPSFTKSKTPYLFYVDKEGYPCNAPPWSELIAINADSGDIAWRVPLGVYKELTARGITGTGTGTNEGAPIATATGLVFVGATADHMFRAFDSTSGRELWSAALDNSVLATPMSYQGANGYQYIVAVAGGGEVGWHHPVPKGPKEAQLVAFALPGATKELRTYGTPPGTETKAQSPDQALVNRTCSTCHALNQVISSGRTREGWRSVVNQMVANGAKASPDEITRIVNYLSRTYPAKSQP